MQVRVDKAGKNSEPGQIKNAINPALPGRHDIDGQAVPNGEISIFKPPASTVESLRGAKDGRA